MNVELLQCQIPAPDGHGPLLLCMNQGKVQDLVNGLVGWEVPPRFERLPKLTVQGLDCVGGVDGPPDVLWEGEERADALPIVAT